MKVGILGSGDVGKALARGFVKHGHEVCIGSRDPTKLSLFVKEVGILACTGTFAEAAKFGEIVVLSTLGTATESAITLAGKENFTGKVVIDTTNPLDFSKGMPPSLFVGFNDSLGERIQKWLPHAHVVKAFNTVGNAHMVNPVFPNGPPTMFMCGNDANAKKRVGEIVQQFGFDLADIGGIQGARVLEPMCIGWVLYGAANNTWNHAFKLLTK